MQSVQVQLTTEQLIEVVKQLPAKERRKVRQQLDEDSTVVKPQRNGDRRKTREETEADLLDRIRLNSSLPDAARHRFNRLRRKLQNETISETELTELQHLTSRAESMAVERLEALVELARLRKMNLNTLMRELGLDKHHDVF